MCHLHRVIQKMLPEFAGWPLKSFPTFEVNDEISGVFSCLFGLKHVYSNFFVFRAWQSKAQKLPADLLFPRESRLQIHDPTRSNLLTVALMANPYPLWYPSSFWMIQFPIKPDFGGLQRVIPFPGGFLKCGYPQIIPVIGAFSD